MSTPPRYQAPPTHGAVLAVPPLSDVGPMLAANRSRLETQPHATERRAARQALLEAASAYLRAAGEPIPDLRHPDSIVLAGHQPELFHPGVWVKNFALNGLARRHHAAAVNLIIDNDILKTTSLKVPHDARLTSVPYDRWTSATPYEERRVVDEAMFAAFAGRVADVSRDWGFEPMLEGFWAEVRRQGARTGLIGERFAAARRALERRWGCHNLETPWHLVCQTASFARFAMHVVEELPRFHGVYNAGVQDYRRRHGIRSRSHPVPDLAEEDGWFEAPFWGWRAGAARRGRLFARRQGRHVALRLDAEPGPTVPLDASAWLDLERQGLKVRSRALTTTLFARMFLCDLFVHGIGGGKYDELTDVIIRGFYAVEPPGYLVLSATYLLPFTPYGTGPEDCVRLVQQLRDLACNPQRHLAAAAEAAAGRLAAEKQRWIASQPADAVARKERYYVLQMLTRQLRPHVAEQQQTLAGALTRCRRELETSAVLRRRDYAFCLYPEASLRDFLSSFLRYT